MARALSWAERMKLEQRTGRRGARAFAHERVAQALEPVLAAPPPPNLPRELVAVFVEELRRLVGRAAPELVEADPADAGDGNTPASPAMPE
jgi:hypothetical protein